MPSIRIAPYAATDGAEVRAHILAIQRDEFSVPITAEQQPDLFDIAAYYQRGSGEFWVAWEGGRVVGTIALFDLSLSAELSSESKSTVGRESGPGASHGICALRKMFVAPSFRGAPHRLGQRLLNELLGHARQHAVREVYLGTTQVFVAAHRFYERNGFQEITPQALPSSWPPMGVDTKFYRLQLS